MNQETMERVQKNLDLENDNKEIKKMPRKRPRTKAIRIELKNRVIYFNFAL